MRKSPKISNAGFFYPYQTVIKFWNEAFFRRIMLQIFQLKTFGIYVTGSIAF